MPLQFDKPCKFSFELVIDPDGTVHSRYSFDPRSSLLFPMTSESVSNFLDHLGESIVIDFDNLNGVQKLRSALKNKEASICK